MTNLLLSLYNLKTNLIFVLLNNTIKILFLEDLKVFSIEIKYQIICQ